MTYHTVAKIKLYAIWSDAQTFITRLIVITTYMSVTRAITIIKSLQPSITANQLTMNARTTGNLHSPGMHQHNQWLHSIQMNFSVAHCCGGMHGRRGVDENVANDDWACGFAASQPVRMATSINVQIVSISVHSSPESMNTAALKA